MDSETSHPPLLFCGDKRTGRIANRGGKMRILTRVLLLGSAAGTLAFGDL